MGELSHTPTSSSDRFERKQHINNYSITVLLFICISSAAYGYAGSVIATTLTQPSFHETMGLETATNAESLIGAMNGLYYTGGIFGSFLAGWTSNTYGRKFSAILGNVLLLLSGALLTASVNPAMFIVFRFVSGLGSFVILAGIPLWVAELAPPKMRGIITDIHAVGMMTGYAIASYTGLGFYFVAGRNQWRGPIGIQMVLPTIVLCGIYWMPESPRFLLSKDRYEEAWSIIHRMHSDPNDASDEFAKREFYQMRKQIELDNTFKKSYWEIFTKPSLRRRALTTIFFQFCLMSSGILVILNYGSIIWKGLGFTTVQTLNFQGGFQLCGLVFNLIAMLFVDRVKRNYLISFGFSCCVVVMICLTTLQKYFLESTNRSGLISICSIIFLYQTVYSVFLDGACFFYIAEIWPSHVRAQGFALAMSTMCLTNITWLMAAPHAFVTIGWKFYLFFIIIPASGAVVSFFFFKDTLHKPLEEIAAMFGDEDEIAVYQRELDLSQIPIDVIEQALPEKGSSTSSNVGESEEIEEKK